MTDARDVASAGAMAVSHMKWSATLKANEAAACVRALRHIGGDEALAALRDYAKDSRQTVRAELLRTWDFFDSEEYASEVLSRMPALEGTLVLTRKPTLAGLHALSWIRGLELARPALGIDLSELSSLKSLESLVLDDVVEPAGVKALAALSSLRTLAIRNSLIKDELPIGKLERLTRLVLIGGDAHLGKDSLRELRELNELEIVGIHKLAAMPTLREDNQLGSINISMCSALENIDTLRYAKNLRRMRLIRCPLLTNMTVLRDLPQLTELVIRGVDSARSLRISLNHSAKIQRLAIDAKAVQALGDLRNMEPIGELAIFGLDKEDDLEPLIRARRQGAISTFMPRDISPLARVEHIAALSIASPLKGKLESMNVISQLRMLRVLSLSGRWVDVDFGVLERTASVKEFDLSRYTGPMTPELLSRLRNASMIKISRWHVAHLERGGLRRLPKNVVVLQ